MPLALLGLLNNPLVRYGLLALAVMGFVFGAIKHYEAKGAARALAAEQARAHEVADYMQRWAEGATQRVDDLEKKNAELAQRSKVAGVANRHQPCFDGPAVDRLRAISGPHPH